MVKNKGFVFLLIVCVMLAIVSGCSGQEKKETGANSPETHKLLLGTSSQGGTTMFAPPPW